MDIRRDVHFLQLQRRVTVLERALKELVEMNSMMALEISVFKRKIADGSSHNDDDRHSSSQSQAEDLDIPQIQRALRQQAQFGAQGISQMGRVIDRDVPN